MWGEIFRTRPDRPWVPPSLLYNGYPVVHRSEAAFVWRWPSAKVKDRVELYIKVKWSRYRPSVAQRVGRGIALLFLHRGTRRRWVVSSTPRPYFTTGKDPVPIVQEAGWAPGPVWTGAENIAPTGIRSPDRPGRSQSLYRLSYRAHKNSG